MFNSFFFPGPVVLHDFNFPQLRYCTSLNLILQKRYLFYVFFFFGTYRKVYLIISTYVFFNEIITFLRTVQFFISLVDYFSAPIFISIENQIKRQLRNCLHKLPYPIKKSLLNEIINMSSFPTTTHVF